MPVTLKFDPNPTQQAAAVIADASEKNDGVMTKAMVKKLNGLTPGSPPNAYVVQPGAPSAGTFTTIAAAVAAAVADGCSALNPKTVLLNGGSYTGQSLVMVDGLTVAGADDALLAGCHFTMPVAGAAFVRNVRIQQRVADAFVPVDLSVASTALEFHDCSFTDNGGSALPFGRATGGSSISLFDCAGQQTLGDTVGMFQAVTGGFSFTSCTLSSLGGPCVGIDGTGGIATCVATDSSFSSDVGTTLVADAGSGQALCFLTRCSVIQTGGSVDDGVSLIGTCYGQFLFNYFQVTDQTTNRAIRGTNAVVSFLYSGNSFDNVNGTNRVSTTQMGAAVHHIVIDAITAV